MSRCENCNELSDAGALFCTKCGAALPPPRRSRHRLASPESIRKAAAAPPQNLKADIDSARGWRPVHWANAGSGIVLFSRPASDDVCRAHRVSAEVGQAYRASPVCEDLPGFGRWIAAPLVTDLAAFVASRDRISWIRLRHPSMKASPRHGLAGQDERFVGLGLGAGLWALAARLCGGEELHLEINTGESDDFRSLGTLHGRFDPDEAVWLGGSEFDFSGQRPPDGEIPFDYVPRGDDCKYPFSTVWIATGGWFLSIDPARRGIDRAVAIADRGPPLALRERMRHRIVEPLAIDRRRNIRGVYLTAIKDRKPILGYVATLNAGHFAPIRDLEGQTHIVEASGEATALVTSVGRIDLFIGAQRLHDFERNLLTSAFVPSAGDGWLAALLPIEPGPDNPHQGREGDRIGSCLHIFSREANGLEPYVTKIPILGRTSNGLPPLLVDDALVLMTTDGESDGEEVYLVALPILS